MVELSKKALRSWTRLMRAHARTSAAIEERLKSAGLPAFACYALLNELERGPVDGLRPFELEHATGEPQYGVSRLSERLAKAGLIRRTECADDRRGWRISLTDEGRAMRGRMWDVYSAVLAETYVDRLGDKQIKALDDILGDLVKRKP